MAKCSSIEPSCIRVQDRWFSLWGSLCEPHLAVNGIEPNVIEWAETGSDGGSVCECVCVKH